MRYEFGDIGARRHVDDANAHLGADQSVVVFSYEMYLVLQPSVCGNGYGALVASSRQTDSQRIHRYANFFVIVESDRPVLTN